MRKVDTIYNPDGLFNKERLPQTYPTWDNPGEPPWVNLTGWSSNSIPSVITLEIVWDFFQNVINVQYVFFSEQLTTYA